MKNKVIMPFNVEKAKAGTKVCTRDGREARIICYDCVKIDYPIVALVKSDNYEYTESYTIDGKYSTSIANANSDLMLVENEEDRQQFKPFDKVLVRDSNEEKWVPAFFAYYDDDDYGFPYNVIGEICYSQCIKFEGNECLTGTTNKPILDIKDDNLHEGLCRLEQK